MVPKLIRICRIQWCGLLFSLLSGNTLLAQVCSKKIKINNLSWNLVARLIQMYVIIMSRTSSRVNWHYIACLNVKELLAGSRHHIWSLSDSNEIRTHNHLVRKRTLNYLAKFWPVWLNGWVFIYELSGCGFESRCCHLN